MATETIISEEIPTSDTSLLKPGDLWLQPSSGSLRVCLQVNPIIVFAFIADTVTDVVVPKKDKK